MFDYANCVILLKNIYSSNVLCINELPPPIKKAYFCLFFAKKFH